MDLFRFLRRPVRAALPQPVHPAKVTREPQPPGAPLPNDPSPPPSPLTPDEVRRLLLDAVASGDESRLRALCDEHEDLIDQHSASWLEVPPQFRNNPELSDWYQNGLHAISRYCAERSAQQRLSDGITQLLGGPLAPGS